VIKAGARFDLAIIDLRPHPRDAMEAAGEIRKLHAGAVPLPLILLTRLAKPQDGCAGTDLSSANFLSKPIKPSVLLDVVLRTVSGVKPAPTPKPTGKLDPHMAERLPLRILICDDNAINQKVAARVLQQMGYKGDVVNNGIEAVSACKCNSYDIVFMDVMMPVMDGLEATREIRKLEAELLQKAHADPSFTGPGHSGLQKARLPVIIVAMTASAMQGDREKCLEAGMNDYISKPVKPEELRAIVERWGAPPAEPTKKPANESAAPVPSTQKCETCPVDMDRLLEFTYGDGEGLRDLIELYIRQTREQMGQMRSAINSGSAQELRRTAHSCAGSSATCGVKDLVPLLRELEQRGQEGNLANAEAVLAEAEQLFERARTFLENHLHSIQASPA